MVADAAENLTPEERELLVAYLDGELDETTAARIEARLTESAAWRREVESLRRAWDLLDYLPRAQATPQFTEKTLARLSALRRQHRWARRISIAVCSSLAVALVAAAGVLGFYLTYRPLPSAAELSAEDLRVLENRWLYEHIEDLEFVHELAHPDLFGEDQ
ncbi:MAG: hypothetical protein C4297_00775 [Gemmataceae bacterium]